MLVPVDVDRDEGDQREHQRDGQVTCDVASPEDRYLSEEVEPEDEEEQRQEERQELLPLRPEERLGDLVLDEEDDRFDKSLKSGGRHVVAALVGLCGAEEHP